MSTTSADVFKNGILAGQLRRADGGVEFGYLDAYMESGGPSIASTLPISTVPVFTAAGAVPAFFAGLLPEGRRLTALRRTIKTSADDELSLLLAVGEDTIGDVQVVPAGATPTVERDTVRVDKSFEEISFADLLSESGIGSMPTLAGVQDKVSAAMISVPVAQRNARYILKLNPPENPFLVENEAFFLDLARAGEMRVAASRVTHDRDGVAGLLVTRFDRSWDGERIRMLAVEDACQAMGLWPADKYNVTMEAAAAALLRLTSARAVAAQEIYRQLAFAWLTGNGDLHAKNIAILNSTGPGQRISPAYDLPSTLFYNDTVLALQVGGKDTLSPARLSAFADHIHLPPGAAKLTLRRVLAATSELPESLEAAKLPFDRKITDKVGRQLATRHRDLARGLSD